MPQQSEEFQKYLCWDAQTVGSVIAKDIGAIDGTDEFLFLAVHGEMKVNDEENKLPKAEKNEKGVLNFFKKQIDEENLDNRVIAVTGAPGGGKSHLVRWIYVQLRNEVKDCEFIYVPREETQTKVFLHTILDQLKNLGSKDAAELQKKIETAVPVDITQTDLRSKLQLELFRHLKHDLVNYSVDEDPRILGTKQGESAEDGIERINGLADLISTDAFWRDKGSVIYNLAKSLTGTVEDERTEFSAADFDWKKLKVKVSLLRMHEGNRYMTNLIQQLGKGSDFAETAATYLNDAIRPAVETYLGLKDQGISFREVFIDVRKILRKEKKKLVLIFEDLYTHDVVTGPIYSQFELQPSEELSQIVAMYAITNEPYEKVPDTVRSRQAARFEVSIPSRVADLDEEKEELVKLVSRYMNSARLGKENLKKAYSKAKKESLIDASWVPNACESCVHKEPCHDAFGVGDDDRGNGLYPLNNFSTRLLLETDNRAETSYLSRRQIISRVSDLLIKTPALLNREEFPDKGALERIVEANGDLRSKTPAEVMGDDFEKFPDTSKPPGHQIFQTRVLWCDGKDHPPAIGRAFALKEEGSGEIPGTGEKPPPIIKPPPPEEGDQVLTAIGIWVNDPENEMTNENANEIRDALYKAVVQRIDWSMLHVQDIKSRDSDLVNDLFEEIFRSSSFLIEHAGGAPPAKGSKQLTFPHKSVFKKTTTKDSQIMRFARWVDKKGSTEFKEGGEILGNERGFDIARSEYEVFVSNCATQVEEAILAVIEGNTYGPVEQALVLSVASQRFLGSRLDPDGLENLEVFIDYESKDQDPINRSSGMDKPINRLQEESRTVLNSLFAEGNKHMNFVEAFKSARQGTGGPIVVDVYGLRELAIKTWNKPVETLEEINGKDLEYRTFARLEELKRKLYKETQKIDWEKELGDLGEQLDDVLKFVEAEEEIDNLGALLKETKDSLNVTSNLRPVHIFEEFGHAIERLQASLLTSERVLELKTVQANLQNGGREKLFDSLHAVAELIQNRNDLKLIEDSLNETKDHLEAQSRSSELEYKENFKEMAKPLNNIQVILDGGD